MLFSASVISKRLQREPWLSGWVCGCATQRPKFNSQNWQVMHRGFPPFIEARAWCVVEPLIKKYLDTHLKNSEDHVYLDTHTKMAVCILSWCRGREVEISPFFSRESLGSVVGYVVVQSNDPSSIPIIDRWCPGVFPRLLRINLDVWWNHSSRNVLKLI